MAWCVKCGCAVGEREHKPNHRSNKQDGICGCECTEFTDVNPNIGRCGESAESELNKAGTQPSGFGLIAHPLSNEQRPKILEKR